MRELRLRLLRTTAELEHFVPEWTALWESDPHATPFQHPAWLVAWWRQFGQPHLRAVVMVRGGRTIGLLPFYICCESYPQPTSAPVQNRWRKLLLLGAGTSDYLDGVFAPECTVDDIRRALDLLAAENSRDSLEVLQLRPGSLLMEAVAGLCGSEAVASDACSRGPAVTVAELPTKIRRNAMYYRNRAARRGKLTLEIASLEALSTAFDDLVRLHTLRWQQAGEPGVLAERRVLAWHREALPQLHAAGLLRLYTLRLDAEVLGSLYSLADPPFRAANAGHRTQYFYITAYAPEHADLRPGTLLLALVMEQSAAEGIRTIDMLRGDEDYKRIWHLERVPTLGFSLRHPSSAAAA